MKKETRIGQVAAFQELYYTVDGLHNSFCIVILTVYIENKL